MKYDSNLSSVAEHSKMISEDLVRNQFVVPMINLKTTMGHKNHCGVLFSEEYLNGTIRIHIGNIFEGVDVNAEVFEYESLDELFSNWRID